MNCLCYCSISMALITAGDNLRKIFSCSDIKTRKLNRFSHNANGTDSNKKEAVKEKERKGKK